MHELFPKRSGHAGLIKGLADQGLGGQPVRYNRKLSTALDTVKVVNLPTISVGAVPFSRQSEHYGFTGNRSFFRCRKLSWHRLCVATYDAESLLEHERSGNRTAISSYAERT